MASPAASHATVVGHGQAGVAPAEHLEQRDRRQARDLGVGGRVALVDADLVGAAATTTMRASGSVTSSTAVASGAAALAHLEGLAERRPRSAGR